MDYDAMTDQAREQFAAVSIHHLAREIHTLVELRGRISLAIKILTGNPDPVCQRALAALDGASLDQITDKAPTADQPE